jgi:hypothetical protein
LIGELCPIEKEEFSGDGRWDRRPAGAALGKKAWDCWLRLCREPVGSADADVGFQMLLLAGATIALAGVFVALASELLAAAVAVAGFGSGFDGNKGHRLFEESISRIFWNRGKCRTFGARCLEVWCPNPCGLG